MSENVSLEGKINFATLDILPYGVIVVDKEGKILYYNEREEQIAQRKRSEVVGKNFFLDVAPCTQVKDFYGRFCQVANEQEDSTKFQFLFTFPNNTRQVDITISKFIYNGALLFLISVGDITQENIVRKQILQAERLAQIGEAAVGVAHNFNNLLTAIGGFSELLMMKQDLDEKSRKYINSILKASNDGAEIVKRIKKATQPQAFPNDLLEFVSLNDLLQDSISFTESYLQQEKIAKNIAITFELNLLPNLQPILSKASELREVFVNLIRNAIDAIEVDGYICVSTQQQTKYQIVKISDTGKGMTPEVQQKLFWPLFTTKGDKGTGLGLASSYAIIKQLGGYIEVETLLGKGSDFIVYLPDNN